MRRLTVLYDARCQLCRRVRSWLEVQPKYIELRFIPAGSDLARQRFPELDHAATLQELAVIGDEGEVYWGAKAWLMCLWALRDYREWASRCAAPAMLPLTKGFVVTISRARFVFGQAEAWQQELDCERCVLADEPEDEVHACPSCGRAG